MQTDIVIVGTGAAGLFCALCLPKDKQILMLTKGEVEESDSFLAQGGICVLKDESDYDSYFEDTMHAGHYENRKDSVDVMIRSSKSIIDQLIGYGVEFEKENGQLAYTREGAHSTPRILFHKDITGREITGKLLARIKELPNVTIMEQAVMVDILSTENTCGGVIIRLADGSTKPVYAGFTVLATGGIGGLYTHSTNYPHLTGDALAIAMKHGIELDNLDYIQIHPTTLYLEKPGRRFLISESVRGEGALLYNASMERFVDELLPRDVVAEAIFKQMELDNKPYVWLSMLPIPLEEIKGHFPNIYKHCLEEGYDVTKECIPVVPAQHYFMGGIHVDLNSRTSMERLYAVGETSCNGVHGANRLASNSLLESLVFAERSAKEIAGLSLEPACMPPASAEDYKDYTDFEALASQYKTMILDEIERMKNSHE